MATKTNATTKACINYLHLLGFKVWRNNNGAVYSVKRGAFLKNPNHLLGVPDIIGHSKVTGQAVYVEIKTGKDKLSEAQILFIKEAKNAGCAAYVVKDVDDLINQINAKGNAGEGVDVEIRP